MEYELEFNYKSEYVPEWDETVIHVEVHDSYNNVAVYEDRFNGKLTADEIQDELPRMYDMALINRPEHFEWCGFS